MSAENWANVVKENPSLRDSLMIRWNDYIPHDPTPKQHVFLLLQKREALFGGAAGGGKSDALLMAALQYVDVPGYSAIIFRRQMTDLNLDGALIPRSQEWLHETDAKFKGNKWFFPSGATIQFGYLKDANAKYRYQGSEYQFIGFDELTQFPEDDYLYLFSRLRKTLCPIHTEKPEWRKCAVCREYGRLAKVPLRMRAATNPGGLGHLWVKSRFNIGRDPERTNPHTGGPLYTGRNPERPFIPSFVQDNPYLDQSEYMDSLRELDPITREQLLNGDWGVVADGRFRRSWARYYTVNGQMIVLGPDGRGPTYHINDCRCFIIIDPAASSVEGPADIYENRAKSHNVIGTFLLTPDYNLIWWDNIRFQKEVPDVMNEITDIFRFRTELAHQSPNNPKPPQAPLFVGMEWSPISIGVFQTLQRRGLPMRPLKTGGRDKVVRATDAMNRMEQGKIWLPASNPPWLEALEAELFTWTGHPHEQDDQIDVLAYGAMETTRLAAGLAESETVNGGSRVGRNSFIHEQTYHSG